MDATRPFTRGEVLIVVAGLAIVVVGSGRLFDITVGRRLQKWARSQGYEFVSWEWPPFAGWRLAGLFVNPTYLFTVRDQAGNYKWGRARFLGLWLSPERVDVEWLDHRDHPVSTLLRDTAIVLGVAAVVALAILLFG